MAGKDDLREHVGPAKLVLGYIIGSSLYVTRTWDSTEVFQAQLSLE